MNKTEINGQNWVSIYKETSFGNKYPSSYLVSLYYRIIKNYLPKIEGNRKYRALDFGCSFGANAMMLRDAGLEVYGVDISPDAIKYCIKNGKFDVEHFVSVNLLTEKWPFSKKMDLIIASEVLYYFSDKDLKKLLDLFKTHMVSKGLLYANMPSFNHPLYREYSRKKATSEGLLRIQKSQTADRELFVRVLSDKTEMKEIFSQFDEIGIFHTVEEFESETEEFHFIGMNI
ncbi:MAG: class I SAM-dependent methyltransferase [Agathobacter sp.]|nr:class I SAM-dependent methyltransferase [Agathobacter sp.]